MTDFGKNRPSRVVLKGYLMLRATFAFLVMACYLAGASFAEPSLQLTSPDMGNGAPLKRNFYYTRCGGRNVAPALAWSGAPPDVSTYALTLIDRSVRPRNWSHLIVVNIPANVHALPQGGALPSGAVEVQSNFGDFAYAGPCPPPGTGLHRYEFTIYAFRGVAPHIAADASATQLSAMLSAAAVARTALSVSTRAQ